jgi:phosphate transport system substrate-binding protein
MPPAVLRAAFAAALATLSVLSPAPLAAQDETLRLHGSNTIGQRLAPALVREWATARGLQEVSSTRTAEEELQVVFGGNGRRLVVDIHSHGTGTGYRDLVEGRADLWMASRPATPAEVAGAARIGRLDDPKQEHVIALDGLAVIVHPSNPLRALTVAQVRDLFAGRFGDWSSVGGRPGPVKRYARDDRSGTFDSFRSMVLRDAALASGTSRFESTEQLAAMVAADPAAIGFVGLAGVGPARALAVSDEGTRALGADRVTVGTEDYVLSRRLFLYNRAGPSALAGDFIEFALGSRGQAVVERIGFVSQDVDAVDVAPRGDVSPEYLDLVDGARRLSLNFRFGARTALLDTKALRDVERLADFMRRPESRGLDLILLGFTDGHEIGTYQAISLSNERVDLVAQALGDRGVGARRVRGMGYAAPVASNDSELGRARNRRVEAWVRPREAARQGVAARGP